MTCSPVFDSPEKLARWLAKSNASAFGYLTCSYEQWLTMILGPGKTLSAFVTPHGLVSGVAMASEND